MTESRDLLELDLRPLPTALPGERELSDDELLGQALHDIYPAGETAQLPERTWEQLAPVAREESSRRRRTFLTRRLVATMGPRRVMAYAAALLVLIGAALATGSFIPRHGSELPVITALHTTLKSTATNPIKAALLDNAVVDLRGEAAVDQSSASGVQLQLHAGIVHAAVPKLPNGSTFVVTTPHAEVTVHGTRFSVEQSSEGDTTVSVEEGLVAVRPLDGHRPTLFVRPGESITVKPFAEYFAELQAAVDHAKAGDCNDPQDLVAKYIEAAPPSTDVSLAHTELGLCARKRGEIATAIDQYEQAAQTSTDRSRADNALSDAAQLRAQRDHADGVDAWNRYLKRFPNGLHTDLARVFLGETADGAGPH